jgi:hypothetical protein
MLTKFLATILIALIATATTGLAAEPKTPSAKEVMQGLHKFYHATARPDGSYQAGIDPDYLGMSDSAYSDMAAVTYAVTVHKTFGWTLPYEDQTGKQTGEFQHTGEVLSVTFSPDGNSIAAGAADKAAKVWDLSP